MQRHFRTIFRLVYAAALMASPPMATAQAPLSAADGWALRGTSESCFLTRSFATAAGKLDVRVQAFGPTTPYHLILQGPGLPIRDNRAEIGTIGFGEDVAAKQSVTFMGRAGGLPIVIIPASLPRPHPLNFMMLWFQRSGPFPQGAAQIDRAAERLFIDLPDSPPLTLEFGPMEEAYTRLERCVQALPDEWGQAASASPSTSSEPQLLDGQAFLQRLWFPPNLSMNRVSGIVQLRMTVDSNGRARDCVVQAATGARQFGEHSCEALERRAHFEPAKDTQGRPVSAMFRTAVSFIIYNW